MKLELNYPMVDYLTMTFDDHTPARSSIAEFESITLLDKVMSEGESAKRRWFNGRVFDGVFMGTGYNDGMLYAMLDTPGRVADELFYKCVEQGLKAGSCTRIDLQVTIVRRVGFPLIEMHMELEQTEDRKLKIEGNSTDGYTLYIGSPSSDKRIRIYDKHVKMDGVEHVFWRFEVQYRRQLAEHIFQSLGYDGYEICQFLKGEIESISRKPNTVSSKILKDFWYTLGSSQGARPKSVHYESNTLDWLRTQVEPAIVRLLNSYDYQDRIGAIKLLLEWSTMTEYAAISMNNLPEPPV